MRRIFIGDIHGCAAELRELLDKCEYRAAKDQLYSVGDLVNKGPDSEKVVRIMIDQGAKTVIGNHDLAWLERDKLRDPALAKWLANQPVARVLDDLILVHAGVRPGWTEKKLKKLNGADRDFAVNVRYCDADGNRPDSDWPPPDEPFLPWDEWYEGEKRVVFGHWARRGLVLTDRAIGLDSGCVYGGRLSAWIPEDNRLVQVDSHLA